MLDPVAHSLPPQPPAPPFSSPIASSLLHLFSLFPVFWKNLTWANLTPTAGAGETAELCRLVPFWIRVHVVLSRLSILEIVPQVGSQLGSPLLFSSSYQHASYCQLMTLFLVLLIAESVYFLVSTHLLCPPSMSGDGLSSPCLGPSPPVGYWVWQEPCFLNPLSLLSQFVLL